MSEQAEKSRRELACNLVASCGTGILNIAVTNPINTARVRWQVQGSGSGHTLVGFLRSVLAEDGLWTGLWRPGLFPGLTASVASIGLRYGTYPLVRDSLGWGKTIVTKHADAKVGPTGMFAAGLMSGMAGYFLASPGLMVMTQMQAEAGRVGTDGKLLSGAKIGQLPSYKGMFNAFKQIADAGAANGRGALGALRGLWCGSSVICLRGGVLNASQMTGYDWSKKQMKAQDLLADGPALHVIASVVAALCTTTCSMPFDVTLTFYQSSISLGGERRERYGSRGPLACARVMLGESGPSIFMRGWLPMFGKMLPTCVFSMYIFEQFRCFVGIGYLD